MIQKVLIVDDSKLARMAVTRVLSALYPDWLSLEAPNADEAVLRVKESAPDIVLLDFNMPGRDGIVLATELARLDPKLNIAVISANHQEEVISRTRAAGATFLGKPLTEKALGEFLTAAVERQQAGAS
jgi:DNA-binding NarL/FixJ family response regulator